MEFVEKIKGFFVEPSKSFREVKKEKIEDYLVYFAVLAIIPSILGAAIGGVTSRLFGMNISLGIAIGAIVYYIFLWIGVFVFGAWLHLWIKLLGGKADLSETWKAIVYGNTPYYILGWIPFVAIIFIIWAWIVQIIGLSEYHKIEWWKVLIAEIIAGVILGGVVAGISLLWLPLKFM